MASKAQTDSDTVTSLEQRLEYLTSITTPYSADTPLMRPGLESIQQSIASIKTQLNSVVAERCPISPQLLSRMTSSTFSPTPEMIPDEPSANSFKSVCTVSLKLASRFLSLRPSADAQLRDIISSHTNTAEHSSSSALDLDMGLGLDPASKKEIVLAAEDEILGLAEQLREIEALKGEIDSPAMAGLDQRITALSPIEFTQIQQSQVSAALKEEFMTVLTEYNDYIETLSQMFLYYDSVLNAISAKLDAEGL
ncbi:hypothetical protein BC830DRAFT_1085595 [Chytriomyces sp. MP71]|nr:hypothetical protein BC830DRAFT_1085595 [Chytriomyces sp. MP71]